MRELYPEIQPFKTEFLKVSPLHEIYVEQCGNPEGVPVVFLHGGPGGGISEKHRRFFDPQHYRIVLFDQRGAGKSKPFAELQENTTWDLVHDIEMIRKHLAIRRWMVFGGSWGSTLALAYAITHPQKVSALALRGIFLCRQKEIRWLYQEGASEMYPDAWEDFIAPIPPEERSDFVTAYHKRLTGADEAEQLKCAKAWSIWEARTSCLLPNPDLVKHFEDAKAALPFARIEAHYFHNKAFFESDNYLLEHIEQIRQIPAVIVQGRYDVVCPPISAWDLHKAWPEAHFKLVPDAGHSAHEKGIQSLLVEAMDAFRELPDPK